METSKGNLYNDTKGKGDDPVLVLARLRHNMWGILLRITLRKHFDCYLSSAVHNYEFSYISLYSSLILRSYIISPFSVIIQIVPVKAIGLYSGFRLSVASNVHVRLIGFGIFLSLVIG